jgi:hypothetical protein
MIVRDDHPLYRLALENLLPQRARLRVADPGIDHRPTLVLFSQPQVDVVELERQRHRQPMNAGRHFQRGAGRGNFRERILE